MTFDVQESWDGQTLSTSLEASGLRGSATKNRAFTVVASQAGATTLQVVGAPGIPRLRDPYPSNFFLRCRGHTVTQRGPLLFDVIAMYQSNTPDPNNADNPLLLPAEIEFEDISSEEETDEDIDGNPIATVNGEPLSGVTMPLTDIGWTVTRNLPTFNGFAVGAYTNKVNSAPFLGWPAGTVRIAGIRARTVYTEDFEYMTVSVRFHGRIALRTTNDKAWYRRVRHEGFYVKVGSDIVRAVDANNEPVTSPVPIKLDGTEEADKSVAYWREFQVMGLVDFNQMNLL